MYRSTLLLIAVSVMLLVKFAEKTARVIAEYSGSLEILTLLLLGVLSIGRIRRLPKEIIIFSVLILFSFVFSVHGRVDQYALNQFIVDLKFPLAIVIAYSFVSDELMTHRLPRLLALFVLICIPLIVMERSMRGLYLEVFPLSMIDTFVSGTDWRRSAGMFIHPGPFGIFSAVCILYFYALAKYRGWSIWLAASTVAAFICLLASGQRVELLAVVLTVGSLFVLERWHRPLVMLAIAAPIFLMFILFEDKIALLLVNITDSFTGNTNELAPRVVIMQGAIQIANMSFPYGAGLGTYGGSMSLANPNNVYELSGIASVWWFEDSNYLTDTYWAMPVAELGWIGACILLVAYGYLLKLSTFRVLEARTDIARFSARLSFLILSFLFIDSAAAPIYTGSGLIILLAGSVFAFCQYCKNYQQNGFKSY